MKGAAHGHETPAAAANAGGRWARRLPWAALALGLLYLAGALRPAFTGPYDLHAFGRLPVVDLGRVKPMETLARTSLMILSNKQTLFMDETSATSERQHPDTMHKQPALRWMLDVMAKPRQARAYTVVRIDHPDILALIGAGTDRHYFSVDEILVHADELNRQFSMAQEVKANDRTPYQRQVLRLANQLNQYVYVENVFGLLLVPPSAGDEWVAIEAGHGHDGHENHPVAVATLDALRAWAQQDPQAFNAAVEASASVVATHVPQRTLNRLRSESLFNQTAPFVRAMGLYVLVFLLAAFSWLRLSPNVARAGLWVLGLTLVLHTVGLVTRIYIQGRPPVTNLYSSAVFVGWGAVVLGFVLERLYRNGIGAVTAAVMGFVTLLVAHHLSLSGDTMTQMQAVLDTNFWLATHVVVITLGYAATFLAGFLGILFILRGLFTRGLSGEEGRRLTRMIYGIVCFATLFSFVGTILGGIWADQSWGRFWGWDPKENGALLIVLWNALILHARWGALVRQRGLAVLAVAGNIVTSWSWFGTNMLGVGLHAYGFIDSAVFWMLAFVATQLVIIGLGLIPLHRWRSFAAAPAAAAARPARELPAPPLPHAPH
jgi:ABC-type transport system involved in cytochrome c biogenesis permease subunit